VENPMNVAGYFEAHEDLDSLLRHRVLDRFDIGSVEEGGPMVEGGLLAMVMTYSGMEHLDFRQLQTHGHALHGIETRLLQLAEVSSERQLADSVRSFYTEKNPGVDDEGALMMIQCDPISCPKNRIHQSTLTIRTVALEERFRHPKRHLLLLIHLLTLTLTLTLIGGIFYS